ncbi:HNH endonuclease [Candidatus Saccharibacteria bacterium]|nr:HNH endonuclease [Candidatus Saccharibacteria bacterium]
MPKQRSWTNGQLIEAVTQSYSVRSVIVKLGLIPAGGNYAQVNYTIAQLHLDISHFKGKAWNKGAQYHTRTRPGLPTLLCQNSYIQSFKLKKRLFEEGVKFPKCEICGWSQKSKDGRIPVELDHINGDHYDNRLCNLRILCPNCHSLQPTHRGRNKKTLTGGWWNRYTRST